MNSRMEPGVRPLCAEALIHGVKGGEAFAGHAPAVRHGISAAVREEISPERRRDVLKHCDLAFKVGLVGQGKALSVGGVGSPTVAAGREAASHPAESPALCTTCDCRLTDVVIRACSVRDCPHAQREAA